VAKSHSFDKMSEGGAPEIVQDSSGSGQNAGPSTNYAALLSAAPQIGNECLAHNKAFIKCKAVNEHPAACLSKGEKVTACVLKV